MRDKINKSLLAKEESPMYRTYFFTAFRVFNKIIRFSVLRYIKNHNKHYYRFNKNHAFKPLFYECLRIDCTTEKHCDFGPYIGEIFVPDKSQDYTSLFIANSFSYERLEVELQILDVRFEIGHYKHQLGVCVQPIYYGVDWSRLIYFFEYWIHEGATLFVFYLESYTKDLEAIFEMYKKTSQIEIEFVNISLLPTNARDLKENPNMFIHRLEPQLAIFDCVHRTRGRAKFISQTDLDEIFLNLVLYNFIHEKFG
uniref:Glycosyltransferase family 92 protein n=1 Tax=Acrobeloides nanus TaxID=290746 RepID=A0A914C953_9BILA